MIRIFWYVMVAVLANVLKVYEGQVFPSVALRCALPLPTGVRPRNAPSSNLVKNTLLRDRPKLHPQLED